MLVCTVVNALGAIVDREGNVARGHYNPETSKRDRVDVYASLDALAGSLGEPSTENTTLTLVVTNQKLERLQQLARHVHSSMARGIYPFHTSSDGDILFAATTNEVENPNINEFVLSHIASELAWDAVLCSFERQET